MKKNTLVLIVIFTALLPFQAMASTIYHVTAKCPSVASITSSFMVPWNSLEGVPAHGFKPDLWVSTTLKCPIKQEDCTELDTDGPSSADINHISGALVCHYPSHNEVTKEKRKIVDLALAMEYPEVTSCSLNKDGKSFDCDLDIK